MRPVIINRASCWKRGIGKKPTPPAGKPRLDPLAVVDRTGIVHVAWFRQRALTAYDVYYATLQEDTSGAALAPAGGLKLTDFAVTEGAILYGPLIGLDAETETVVDLDERAVLRGMVAALGRHPESSRP